MKNLNNSKSKFTSFILLFRLLKISSEKKSKKIIFFSILLVVNGLAELLSLISIVPFLSILSNPESLPKSKFFSFFLNIFQIQSDQVIIFSTIIFISFIVIALLIRVFTLKCGLSLTAELGTTLATKTLSNIIYQPYSFQISKNSGETINILTTEVENANNAIFIAIRLSTALVTFLFIFFGMLAFNFHIASGCFILFGSSYLFITKKSSKKVKTSSFIITASNNKIVQHIQDTIGSIRDLIIDNNRNYYVSTFKGLQTKNRNTKAEVLFIGAYPSYFFESLAFITFALLGLTLSLNSSSSSDTISILGTVAIGLQKLLRAMQQIYVSVIRINSKKSCFLLILNAFKQKLKSDVFNIEKDSLNFNSSIRLKNVRYRYGRNLPWTIKKINLSIEKGQVVGLIGKTGSGKSTLIDLIMGLLDPTEGEILIDEKNITKDYFLKQKWFNSISHVPQDVYLCDGTFIDNIALGVPKDEVNYNKIINAAEVANIKEFIDSSSLGFNTFVGERGIKLSGGQKQRIAIARAIYKQSQILILDEATSALDNKTEDEIIKSINSLDKNITILMIAHRLSSLSFCNKIVEIGDGQIISSRDSIDFKK